jgi:hypothetical protein
VNLESATDGTGARAGGRSAGLESLSVVALGAKRLIARWPGLASVPVSYGIAAACLYDHAYGYIISAVIAGAVGVGWYASPLRGLEARRRDGRPAGHS